MSIRPLTKMRLRHAAQLAASALEFISTAGAVLFWIRGFFLIWDSLPWPITGIVVHRSFSSLVFWLFFGWLPSILTVSLVPFIVAQFLKPPNRRLRHHARQPMGSTHSQYLP